MTQYRLAVVGCTLPNMSIDSHCAAHQVFLHAACQHLWCYICGGGDTALIQVCDGVLVSLCAHMMNAFHGLPVSVWCFNVLVQPFVAYSTAQHAVYEACR